MSWNEKLISSQEPSNELKEKFKSVSPPVLRFFGSLGFLATGLGAMKVGSDLLEIPAEFWLNPTWDFKHVIIMIIALLAGLIGTLIGMGFGTNFKIKSEKGHYYASVLWNFYANGSLVLIFLVLLCLRKDFNLEEWQEVMKAIGLWKFSLIGFIYCGIGSLLLGVLLSLFGLFSPGRKVNIIFAIFAALPFSLLLAKLLLNAWTVQGNYWIFIGIVFPISLIPINLYFMLRDQKDRQYFL